MPNSDITNDYPLKQNPIYIRPDKANIRPRNQNASGIMLIFITVFGSSITQV